MERTRSLLEAATRFRSRYAPIWALPIFMLIAKDTLVKIGNGLLFVAIFLPLSFFCFYRSLAPWLNKQVSYWHSVTLTMIIPFLIFAVGVQFRLAINRSLSE